MSYIKKRVLYIKNNKNELEGEGLASSLLNLGSRFIFKPKEQTTEKTFKQNEKLPPKVILYNMENEAYSKTPDNNVEGWKLLYNTATLKFYNKADVIVVAIRGTADFNDTYADMHIALGRLEKTSRVKDDLKELLNFQKQYPPNIYYYFGVGHSLGGAILDIFLNKGLIRQGISYNPAVETKYMNNDNNLRIYNKDDLLYATMGKYASNVELRENKINKATELIKNYSDLGRAGVGLKAHLLSNFVGGRLVTHIAFI